MEQTKLKIVTQQGIYFEGLVDLVTVKTIDGYIGFNHGRIPYVSILVPSKMNYRLQSEVTELYIAGGIVQATPTVVKILTDQVSNVSFEEKINTIKED